jgi:hypothetical protein
MSSLTSVLLWVPKNSARKKLLTLGLFRLSFRSSVHSGDVMRDFESLPFHSIVAVNLRLETRVWRMEGRSREIEEERSRRIDEESWSLKYNPRSFFSVNNLKRVLKYCFQIDRDFFRLHSCCKHFCMLHRHYMPFRGISYLQVVSSRYYMCISLCGVFNYMTFSSYCPPVVFWTPSTEFLHHPSGVDLFFGSHVPDCGTRHISEQRVILFLTILQLIQFLMLLFCCCRLHRHHYHLSQVKEFCYFK